ncbi:MAG: S1 RNA-binding domain-containing protein [Elusimicrobiota bacterium]
MVEEKISMEDVVKQVEEVQKDNIVSGTVLDIDEDEGEVLVDIGHKQEGLVNLDEFDEDINVGDEVEVYIVNIRRHYEELIKLSHSKAKLEKKFNELEKSYEDDLVIDAHIEKRVKGGLIVDILNGVKAFMPASLAGYPMVKNLDSVVGKTVPCKIIEFNKYQKNIIVSWKKAVEEDVRRKREELFEQLYPGKLIKGTVSGIKSFGAFINLGGIDGLLHISELSWGHVDKVEDVLEKGEEVEVKVKSFDPKSNRIALSLKETKPHPWENIEEKYDVGQVVEGSVTGVTSYGAFVKLEEGVEGLVRIEEISWTDKVNHAGDKLEKGEQVDVKILSIEPESKRIALSIKQAKPNPWEEVAEKYNVGNVIEGEITHLTNFGAFMMLKEGVEGLIHISDMSWKENIGHPSEVVEVGDEVEVKILGIDIDKQKISLGLKQLEDNPYNDYPKGTVVENCDIQRVQRSGAYVQLDNGLEAYLHISNYSKERIDDLRDHLEEGDKIDACKVVKCNPRKDQLEVSIKKLILDNEKEEMEKYIDSPGDSGAKLRDVLGDKLSGIMDDDNE